MTFKEAAAAIKGKKGETMPTERFYRLPDEKKKVIRDAAAREFIRVPFEKVSINQIIQDADISRGSFYTYFEDKRDVLSFIFEDMREKAKVCGGDSLCRTGGNFWIMMEDLLDFTVQCCENDDIFRLSKNTMVFHDEVGIYGEAPPGHNNCHRQESKVLEWLYEHTDRTGMQLEGKEDFMILVDMGMANLMVSAAEYYRAPSQVETLKSTFRRKMEILRNGIYKDSTA